MSASTSPSCSFAALQSAGDRLDGYAAGSLATIQSLRQERVSMAARLSELEQKVVDVPELERELLYHADRADSAERELFELRRMCASLKVLAYGRLRSRNHLVAAAALRSTLTCVGAMALANALRTWRDATQDPPPMPQDPHLLALEYQNLLLQRAAVVQAKEAKHEAGATIILGHWSRIEIWLLSMVWRQWITLPRPLAIPRKLRDSSMSGRQAATPCPIEKRRPSSGSSIDGRRQHGRQLGETLRHGY